MNDARLQELEKEAQELIGKLRHIEHQMQTAENPGKKEALRKIGKQETDKLQTIRDEYARLIQEQPK